MKIERGNTMAKGTVSGTYLMYQGKPLVRQDNAYVWGDMNERAVLFLLVLMPVAKMIPMPIIAAILFMVAYNMSEWRHFVHICRHSPKSDVLVLVVTFTLTVVFDLVVAIAVGLVLAAVLFMKRMSDVTRVRKWKGSTDVGDGRMKQLPEGVSVYEINGPMFFADTDKFSELLPEDGTRVMIIRMSNVPSVDVAAVTVLENLFAACAEKEVSLILSHVNPQPMLAIKKSGLYEKLGADGFADSIDDAIEKVSKL